LLGIKLRVARGEALRGVEAFKVELEPARVVESPAVTHVRYRIAS
jgi:hypothetical protein